MCREQGAQGGVFELESSFRGRDFELCSVSGFLPVLLLHSLFFYRLLLMIFDPLLTACVGSLPSREHLLCLLVMLAPFFTLARCNTVCTKVRE